MVAVALLSGCAAQEDPDAVGPNAVVVAVVDGDTIDVAFAGDTERVRLVGVDTPEIAHPARGDAPASLAECFADEAHAFLRGLLPEGRAVRIERDTVGRDHYDRVLGYVHLPDGVFANYELVRQGFARTLSIAPNQTFDPLFVEAARAAERDDVGLWAACADVPAQPGR